jgi:hypothetical protein
VFDRLSSILLTENSIPNPPSALARRTPSLSSAL